MLHLLEVSWAGGAKAMVVTTGRQHALDLYQAVRKWDQTLPGCGFGVLVAFSGSLNDAHSGLEFTEGQLNGFPEGQLPDKRDVCRQAP
jgi:type I restriction enzyme R subunit